MYINEFLEKTEINLNNSEIKEEIKKASHIIVNLQEQIELIKLSHINKGKAYQFVLSKTIVDLKLLSYFIPSDKYQEILSKLGIEDIKKNEN